MGLVGWKEYDTAMSAEVNLLCQEQCSPWNASVSDRSLHTQRRHADFQRRRQSAIQAFCLLSLGSGEGQHISSARTICRWETKSDLCITFAVTKLLLLFRCLCLAVSTKLQATSLVSFLSLFFFLPLLVFLLPVYGRKNVIWPFSLCLEIAFSIQPLRQCSLTRAQIQCPA